jgi:hypothetical protein
VLAFLRCDAPQRGWTVAPLSHPIAAQPGASHPFDHVPEADTWVLLSGADRQAVYELVPPLDPTQTWAVTRRPLGSASLASAYVAGKRWSYAPALKAFVWMASSTSGVVAYRPFGV